MTCNAHHHDYPHFSVSGRIAGPSPRCSRPSPTPTSCRGDFTTGGAQGRLTTGSTVTWDFADFPGAFPVQVIDVVRDDRIVLHWDAP